MKLYPYLLTGLLILSKPSFSQANAGLTEAGNKSDPTKSKPSGIASRTGGLAKYEGYFNFYYDEKEGRIFLEIDKFDQEFLYVNTLPSGVGFNGMDRGNIGGYRIVKFIKSGPKIFLIEPNQDYRAISDNPYERKAVEESFAQSVIWGFKPEAVEGNKVLIDFTPFLLRDSHKVGERLGKSLGAVYRVDDTRSSVYLERTKSFPKNSEFEAIVTLVGSGQQEKSYFSGSPGAPTVAPDPNAVTVRMHHSLIELPDSNYKPRKFDPRSGFNYTEYMDFATPIDQPLVKKYIRRFRLQKKNPGAVVSEPVQPIIYYIDRGAPENVRQALMEGASWWNQAFEAVGYKNAFQVKLLPEGADPMDIRYNVINWVHRASRGYSNGVGIFDPRTGEIIKGEVTLGSMRDRQDFLIAEGLLQPYAGEKKATDQAMQMALARIRQLAAHEVGHTLGFFHNYTGSADSRSTVMDYPPPTYSLKSDGSVDLSDAYAKGIGSYDKRAVLWGYQDFPKSTNEETALKKIMQETLKQGHLFLFDYESGSAEGVHPLSGLWDSGPDAADELNRIMKIRRHVLDNFSEKAIPEDAPMATLQEVLVPIYLLHRYQVDAAAHILGGLHYTFALKNDGQVVTKMIDPSEQWKAFDALMNTLTPDALALSEKLIRLIPPRPIGYPKTKETFDGYTGLTFDPLGAAESAANATIVALLDPHRAARLVEYHARDEKQPGLLEVLNQLIDRTWKSAAVSGYKGELQRLVNHALLKHLLVLAANNEVPAHVRAQVLLQVHELRKWMISKETTAEGLEKGSLLFGLEQIDQYLNSPNQYQAKPMIETPAGAPIG